MVRKNNYNRYRWDSNNVNAWANSSMRSWLNVNYPTTLQESTLEKIGTTTYYFTLGNGDSTITSRADAFFILSLGELNLSHYGEADDEGSPLSIASTLQISHNNDGLSEDQWNRTPNTQINYGGGNTEVFRLENDGSVHSTRCDAFSGAQPCFTLPSTTTVDENLNLMES